jgi:S-adenosylmethionine:tRNA ribosyltransferase-isomerase
MFAHASGAFTGTIVAREADGSAVVRFTTAGNQPITAIANELGGVPLPPYIRRQDESNRASDLERYQTVYANRERQVAVAAPTAGLHFTPELLAALASKGIRTADVTLHVGLGTFKPITTDTVEAHEIHREYYELPAATMRALSANAAGAPSPRTDAGNASDITTQPRPASRRIAIGTTTVRTLEDYLSAPRIASEADFLGEAGIFIYPPFRFRAVDALVTNFHQPRSTLLCLVAAFLGPGSTDGITWLREIYAEAVAEDYRFLSYGDAMLIL